MNSLEPVSVVEPYVLHFKINGLPKTTNAARSKGWRNRYKEDNLWKKEVMVGVCQGKKPKKPLELARITLVRHSSNEPDYEGLVSTFKPILDALIITKVIVDDKVKNIGRPDYIWQYAPPKTGFIEITVESIPASDLREVA